MDNNELYSNLVRFAYNKLPDELLVKKNNNENISDYINNHFIPIPKKDLIIGNTYDGECRNADKATWNGKTFTYLRYKFGYAYMENINHYEDDDGYDVFIPIKQI